MKPAFGIIGAVVNIVGYVPYIRDIVRGKVKPQRVTWGIWSILTLIVFINQLSNGGGYSSLFFGTTTGLVCITFLLSLKYGMGGSTRSDKIMLCAAGVLFMYWIIAGDREYSTYIAVVIDTLGALPTVLKVRVHPESETYPQWVLAGVGAVFSCLALESYTLVLVVYPLYVLVMNAVIVGVKMYAEAARRTQKVSA